MYMYSVYMVYLYSRRNDHLLSPVPENTSGRLNNSSFSDVGVALSTNRGWNQSHGPMPGQLGNRPLHRSMEMVS